MNQDDCVKLAEEYGTPTSNKWHENCVTFNPNQLAAFCQALQDRVREECAKVCEEFDFNNRVEISEPKTLPRYCAAAIRAIIKEKE